MDLFWLTLFGVHSLLCIYKFCLSLILKVFNHDSFWDSKDMNARYLLYKSWRPSWSLFSLYCSDWINSIDLSSTSWILCSVISTRLLIPSNKLYYYYYLSYCIFEVCNFCLVHFYNIYLFAEIIYLFRISREFVIDYWIILWKRL
jgi:hypothetical protein